MDAGEPSNAVPRPEAVSRPGIRRRPESSTPPRTRAVVALVRPLRPNPDVLRAAAELALDRDVALLVLGTLDPLVADWVDGIDIAGPTLDAAHGELFATSVETLWDRPVTWGVNVLWGRLAPEVNRLAARVDIVSVVHGSRRPDTGRHRLRRRVTGRLDALLADQDVGTVHAV